MRIAKSTFTLLGLVFLIGFAIGIFAISSPKTTTTTSSTSTTSTTISEPTMTFSYKDCDGNISPYNQSNLGVKEKTWLDDKTLFVKAYVSINCAESIKGGGFSIIDSNVSLIYKTDKCSLCTLCMCAHEINYRFDNLENKDYNFELALEYV